MPTLVGVPVADAGQAGGSAEPPLSASRVYWMPFSWQNTRLWSCQASPAPSRSAAWRFLCTVRASMARLGSMSERRDWGVLVSPPFLAERQTWMIPWYR
jgi:hypothetical protein